MKTPASLTIVMKAINENKDTPNYNQKFQEFSKQIDALQVERRLIRSMQKSVMVGTEKG